MRASHLTGPGPRIRNVVRREVETAGLPALNNTCIASYPLADGRDHLMFGQQRHFA
jgi:hypothetical protein